MKNSDYLIPPVHGEVRNPKGRGKGVRNRATIYRDIAEMGVDALKIHADHLPKGIDVATATAIAMFRKAILDGDVAAAREAFDSAFGKNADVLIDQSAPKKMVLVVRDGDIPEPDTE